MDKKLVIAAVDVIASNTDILCEILVRLPASSLIRFSAVCKLWYSIIMSMPFRIHHSRCLAFANALPPTGIYFYNCLAKVQNLESLSLTDNVSSLPPLHDELTTSTTIGGDVVEVIDFKVTQSCNGLFMCILTERSNTSTSRKGLVYNPVNKFRYVLPTCTMSDEWEYYNLISYPEPPYYKALCATYLAGGNLGVSSMGLYMLEGDSWRHCGSMDATGHGFDSGVFWNGAIHWIGVYFSVYFVVSSEEVGRIELPMAPRGPCNQKLRYFGESGGHLHLIRVKNLYAKKFIVLELDKDTLTWSMKYRVHLAKLISTFPEMAQQTPSGTQYAYSILSLIRGEMEEDSVLLLTIPGKVVTYNLVLKTVNVIRELPGEVHDTLRFDHLSSYQYTASFAPGEDWTIDPK
ncbi:hypothetical protein FXO38_30436 [Capsicum annuum]|nr:hypothetical protein FXO38_30436 [Capsicum annuum]KAF3637865.1 hypothetical protein FXO37_24678 [Capsicum annuum]